MDVRCERCRAQYVFDDDQVTPTGLTVQCTNCGHLFMVKKKELVVTVPVKPDELLGTPVPASAPGLRTSPTPPRGTAAAGLRRPSSPGIPAAASEAPPREWRLRHPGGSTFAFRELTTLQKWIIEQKVGRDDEISLSGEQWKRLGDIPELASFFEVVEAAERSRAQAPAPPAHLTPMPMPMSQATGAVPLFPPPPPPPSGFPPPSFAAPRVQAAAPALAAAAPVHEVEVSFDDEPPPPRKASPRPVLVIGVALVLLGAGAAAVVAPRLLGPARAPAPVVLEAPPAPPPAAAQPAPAPAVAEAPPPTPAPQPAAPEAAPPVSAPAAKGAAAAPKAPQTPRALLARAKALQQRGDAAGALELFGRLASDDPGNVEAQAGRGLCYLDLESWAPAEASFQAALRVEPDHADALLGLAETYRFQGKKAQAIPMYERYLARYPDGEEAQVAKNALAELRE
jgi:predicted Zn finger-like uncharacterized protein